METCKTGFRYYGAKQNMVSKILPLIPAHTVWAEPFCGSAAITAGKPCPKITNTHHYREAINDNNRHVYNFFKVLQNENLRKELLIMLEFTPYSRDERKDAYKVLQNPELFSKVEWAHAFFVQCNSGVSGLFGGDLGFGRRGPNNVLSAWLNYIDERLLTFTRRLRHCYIENISALDFIKKWDSEDTCFYVDPPYWNSDCKQYTTLTNNATYTQQDFIELVELLQSCKASVILSCYPNEDMPEKWKLIEFETIKSTGKNTCLAGKETRKLRKTECVYFKSSIGYSENLKRLIEKGQMDCFKGEYYKKD